MMRKILFLLLLCAVGGNMSAQRITRNYQSLSLSQVLEDLNAASDRYEISFVYNDLEDFTVTCQLERASLDDALRTVVGFYPVRIVKDGEKYFVECTYKTERHLTGRIVDEKGNPVSYANVSLLSPADSSLIGGGVSNEAGDFVIPTEASRVIAKFSFVGYKTLYRTCKVGDMGTVQLQSAEYFINGITVKGTSVMNYVDKSVHTFTTEQIEQARNVRDLLEYVQDLRIDPITNKVGRMDGGSVKILLNGASASDIDLKGIPANKIVRVEYYNIPPARYADAGTLINVITKRMDTGVNAGIEARSAFNTGLADATTYLNLTSGNHQLSLSYDFSLREVDDRRNTTTYDYLLNGTQTHYQRERKDNFGYTLNDPTIRYTFSRPDDITVQVKTTPHFDTYHSSGSSDVTIRSVASDIKGVEKMKRHTNTFGPNLNVYIQKTLPKNQQLDVDLVGTYYHNTEYSTDEQTDLSDGSSLLTDNVHQKNDKYSFIGELAYTKKWAKSSLSLGYRGMYGRSNATISNVLSNYEGYDYSSASYQHYMYAEYSGIVKRWMYRIGAGATQVTQDNDDAHDSRWLFTPRFILSTNLSKRVNLQWTASSKSETPAISQLGNNAKLVIPGVMTVGNPYLKSYNTYETELVFKWNLGWLQTQLSLEYDYRDSPINTYYTEQTIDGQQYIVGMNENANYSSDIGGSYMVMVKPLNNETVTLFVEGDVYGQTISSPIIGHYHHTCAPLLFGVQLRKGNWGGNYYGKVVSKNISGSMLMTGENGHHVEVFWQKNRWRLQASCLFFLTKPHYRNSSVPTSILQSSSHTWLNSQRSVLVLGFSYDFSSGKNLKINRKLQNKDSDKGTF